MSTQLSLLDTGQAAGSTAPLAGPAAPPALKPSQARVLAYLAEHPTGTAAEVATATGYQQSCASKRLGELQRLGFVRWFAKQEGPRSRLLRVYKLTDAGREEAS